MAMVRGNQNKKSIDDIKPVSTKPEGGFSAVEAQNRKINTYNKKKEAVLRMDRETHEQLKALAAMSTHQLGSNMKDVISNITKLAIGSFDEYHKVWYEDCLSKVLEAEKKKNNK